MNSTADTTDSASGDSNNQVTLLHNPNCSKSRAALELLTEITDSKQLQLHVHQYLHNPLERAELSELLGKLQVPAAELVRNDKNFNARGLDESNYTTANAVIDLLIEYPDLMQRPIAIFGSKAMIGRPPNDLQELFS